ncbi:MAG TPA: ATP-binding protein [Gemmatimonadaceae bacterium]|nr:ATP-binding protein [Gemmatimonadaceae bacterium]
MILTAAAAVIALGGVVWWRVERAQAREREARRAVITRELRAARREVERWLQERDDEARLAAELAQPTLAVARLAGSGGESRDAARRALDQLMGATASLQRHAGWRALWVFDDRGTQVAASAVGAPTAAELAAVRAAIDGRSESPVARLPLARVAQGALGLSWVVAVPTRDGARGAIILRADPSDILVLPAQNGTMSRTDVAAAVGDEYVIVSPRRAIDSLPRVLSRTRVPAFARTALAGRDTFGVFTDAHGLKVFAGGLPIGEPDWVVVRQTDHRAARGYVVDDLWNELATFSAAMFPLLLVGGLALRRVRAARIGEIRRSESSYRSFVEHSPFGIYRSTADGRFAAVNGAMVGILGYGSREELLTLRDIGQELYADAGERERLVAERLAGTQNMPRDVRWRRKDGRIITVRLSCRPLRDERGALTGWEGFLEDVTPLREAESALRRAETLASMGQLLSGVAHELSNPITAILHFSAELERAALAADDAEAVSLIREQALRCREIVRDLLAMARRREAPREVIDLGALAERAALALRPRLQEQSVVVHLRVPETAACVIADRVGIEQVITNLVSNAADAAGAGGTVTVEVARFGGECLIRVTDDGPGIPAEALPRLFEPFFTTKPEGVGTGLGLPVSLGIIEQHGGRLAAENLPGGRGARFVVSLPATSLRPSPSAGSTPPRGSRAVAVVHVESEPDAPEGARPLALVVDDEPTVRAALRRTLELRGWCAHEASTGGEAAQRVAAQREAGAGYALVLSDYRLTDMTGMTLLERLARSEPDLATRFILCTGDPAALEGGVAARAGCHLVEKPFDFEALGRLVDELRGRLEPADAPAR